MICYESCLDKNACVNKNTKWLKSKQFCLIDITCRNIHFSITKELFIFVITKEWQWRMNIDTKPHAYARKIWNFIGQFIHRGHCIFSDAAKYALMCNYMHVYCISIQKEMNMQEKDGIWYTCIFLIRPNMHWYAIIWILYAWTALYSCHVIQNWNSIMSYTNRRPAFKLTMKNMSANVREPMVEC